MWSDARQLGRRGKTLLRRFETFSLAPAVIFAAVIVPEGVPHTFLNPGPGRLRQTDIHLGKRLQTEWLEEL